MTMHIHLFNQLASLDSVKHRAESSPLFLHIFAKTISLYFITKFLEALFFPAQVKKKF